MPSTFTPNKGFQLQATGEDLNTWGINLNANFSILDLNLGGTLNLNVGGSSNISLSTGQAENLIHNLTGALTGNINYIFPAKGGFYAINNETTGSFTLTVTVSGGSGGIVVPQGNTQTIYIDTTVPQVESFTGTQYNFVGGTVGGTANALTLSQTFPSNYSLNIGALLTITPPSFNTDAVTLTDPDGNTINIKKLGFTGIVDLQPGDIGGFPLILQYDGTEWLALNVFLTVPLQSVSSNQSVGLAQGYIQYICTAPLTLTIAQSTTLVYYWNVRITALGGAVTISINGSDKFNNGSAGVGLVMPQGTSGFLTTDANGNLYLDGTGIPLTLSGATLAGTITLPNSGQITSGGLLGIGTPASTSGITVSGAGAAGGIKTINTTATSSQGGLTAINDVGTAIQLTQAGSTSSFGNVGGIFENGSPTLLFPPSNTVKFASANSFSSNGAVGTVLGSVGPSGSHTTVQTWLTIVDSGGTTRYIPCF